MSRAGVILTFAFIFLSTRICLALDPVPPPPEEWHAGMGDDPIVGLALFDLVEYSRVGNTNLARWDAVGWVGGDYNRIWLKSEGDTRQFSRPEGEAGFQLLYGRLVAPFWDLQIGGRYERLFDSRSPGGRFFAALGLQGLSRYWFDLEPTLFISQDGDVSAQLTAEYDVLLTQRLILQPRFDIDAALQPVERFGVGRGVNTLEAGIRLRYEIKREIAPYVGVVWLRRFGFAADLARQEGDPFDDAGLTAGVRFWF